MLKQQNLNTTKPQRQESLALSHAGSKKYVLQSAWSTICTLYNNYEQSHVQRDLPFLRGIKPLGTSLIHQFC